MLNYLSIVPKASIYVPKVIMHKPIMGGNSVFETFTHMFLYLSGSNFEKWPRQPIWSMMAEHGKEGGIELSSHCAQSLHICPKGNRANQLWVVTPCLRLSHTCFSSEVGQFLKSGPGSQYLEHDG